ncbi:MAG: flagellar basal body-associated FliL family protein [Alphaproteobacteria bacterium]|nr:flagellar basal body-associated FliL family protein [Alphaproteobacteria bacterium]
MRLILIIVGVLLLLGGGGAGAYFYFSKTAVASSGDDIHKSSEDIASGHGDGHGKASGHYEYVELDPLILPIIDNNGVSQTVSVVIALEVNGSYARSRAETLEPKLKDAFIQDMYGVLNKHAALKGGVLQVGMLKSRLTHVSKKILGEDDVNDVLLQVVQQRPI